MQMYLNTTAADRPVVNLLELAEVRQHHMPTPLVQFSPLCEVARVAAEVSRKHPRLSEEAAFVVLDEVDRRGRLAGSPLTLS
jgi:hypothetical protein